MVSIRSERHGTSLQLLIEESNSFRVSWAHKLLKFMVSIRSERHGTSLQLLIEESNTQYTYAQFKVSLLTAVFKS